MTFIQQIKNSRMIEALEILNNKPTCQVCHSKRIAGKFIPDDLGQFTYHDYCMTCEVIQAYE